MKTEDNREDVITNLRQHSGMLKSKIESMQNELNTMYDYIKEFDWLCNNMNLMTDAEIRKFVCSLLATRSSVSRSYTRLMSELMITKEIADNYTAGGNENG